jgi:hypothetical protein
VGLQYGCARREIPAARAELMPAGRTPSLPEAADAALQRDVELWRLHRRSSCCRRCPVHEGGSGGTFWKRSGRAAVRHIERQRPAAGSAGRRREKRQRKRLEGGTRPGPRPRDAVRCPRGRGR